MPNPTTSTDEFHVTPVSPNGKTIFIAEDDPFISRMYQTKLINAGFNVEVRTNGREAYQDIKTIHPDLMMLDINMPELSGLEVLTALTNDGYDFNSSPALILTNSSDPALRKQAESLGAEYLVKADLTPRYVLDCINNKLQIKPNQSPAS